MKHDENTDILDAAISIRDKWSLKVADSVPSATRADCESVLTESDAAWRRPWPARERSVVLRQAAEELINSRHELVERMVLETGFTGEEALEEVFRSARTLQLSAEEAARLTGELVPLHTTPGYERDLAFTLRMPRGVVLAITPFNAPLNILAHKIGPALAGGNSVVIKPSPYTPRLTEMATGCLIAAGVPEDRLHVLQGDANVALALLRDDRVSFTSFTGSTRVGAVVKRETGVRPVTLELGSVACTILAPDADIEAIVPQLARNGYRKAGQTCTSVQCVYAPRESVDLLTAALETAIEGLRFGDPRDDATQVGPMIDEAAAARTWSIVEQSVKAGADLVLGEPPTANRFRPALLRGVDESMLAAREEAFGPLVSVLTYEDIGEVSGRVNSLGYGLQAGVFTKDLATAIEFGRTLDVGGVIVNGTSSTHPDEMPFGGVNSSGFGREGPSRAINDMTVERTIVVRT